MWADCQVSLKKNSVQAYIPLFLMQPVFSVQGYKNTSKTYEEGLCLAL